MRKLGEKRERKVDMRMHVESPSKKATKNKWV